MGKVAEAPAGAQPLEGDDEHASMVPRSVRDALASRDAEGALREAAMKVPRLDITSFLARAGVTGGGGRRPLLLDVRSPGEFQSGHIPHAVSLPLFSDDERAEVGTLYKQKGHDAAFSRGLEAVSGKMGAFVHEVGGLAAAGAGAGDADTSEVMVYCWRGGMRSASMAYLLQESGIRAHVLEAGYKSFRRWALSRFEGEQLRASMPRLVVVGGRTGVGKTKLLRRLREMGQQVLDLEGLARHRGSVFGWVGEGAQPTTEHYVNELAVQASHFDADRFVGVRQKRLHESRTCATGAHRQNGCTHRVCNAACRWMDGWMGDLCVCSALSSTGELTH